MAGFEVARKITAQQAFDEFPDRHLHLRPDGQLTGNVVVDAQGKQHPLDGHKADTFDQRLPNYIVGKNPLILSSDEEVARGRAETMEALQEIMKKKGATPKEVIGRWGSSVTEKQVIQFQEWLKRLKAS